MTTRKKPVHGHVFGRLLLTCVLLATSTAMLSAQRNTVSSSGNAVSKSGTVRYTVGQIDYNTSQGAGGVALHGVQQPREVYSITGVAGGRVSLTTSVYPNPTSGVLTLRIEGRLPKGLEYSIVDVNGKLITQQLVTGAETLIDIQNVSNGTYFVRVRNDRDELKTFTVTKTNQP